MSMIILLRVTLKNKNQFGQKPGFRKSIFSNYLEK